RPAGWAICLVRAGRCCGACHGGGYSGCSLRRWDCASGRSRSGLVFSSACDCCSVSVKRARIRPSPARCTTGCPSTSADAAHASHRGARWRPVATTGTFRSLGLLYSAQAYGWYFNSTYLPQFLERQYGVPNTSMLGALYKAGPLLMAALGCLLGGIITDAIT